MQHPPISQGEIDARIAGHLDELLALWQAEQGEAKTRDLELIAAALPLAGGRANQLLGYDHIELLGSRLSGRIDEGSVADWVGLLREAGFGSPDVLWRDADEVVLGAIKP